MSHSAEHETTVVNVRVFIPISAINEVLQLRLKFNLCVRVQLYTGDSRANHTQAAGSRLHINGHHFLVFAICP